MHSIGILLALSACFVHIWGGGCSCAVCPTVCSERYSTGLPSPGTVTLFCCFMYSASMLHGSSHVDSWQTQSSAVTLTTVTADALTASMSMYTVLVHLFAKLPSRRANRGAEWRCARMLAACTLALPCDALWGCSTVRVTAGVMFCDSSTVLYAGRSPVRSHVQQHVMCSCDRHCRRLHMHAARASCGMHHT